MLRQLEAATDILSHENAKRVQLPSTGALLGPQWLLLQASATRVLRSGCLSNLSQEN
jgi:hypothetical protein